MAKPLRVLIVEDSEDDALLVIRELERGGYDTTFERVETAEAMAAALEKQVWDIIIADYSMPHFSAPEALKLFLQSGLDLPFIVVSGTIGEDVAVVTMKDGAHDYLMKGNLKRLVPAVERELKEAEVRRQRRQAQHDLNERVKELECLYSITMIAMRPGVTLDEVYQEVANTIPPGWQYPDITCARISIDSKEFKTPNFKETVWKQDSDIIVDGQRIGGVEVFYLEEKPEGDEGPFLKEERNLINGLTSQLGSFIQRKWVEEAKEHLYLMLRTIRNVNQLIVKEKNRDRLLKSSCDNFTKTRGCNAAWIVLLDDSGRLITATESGWGKDFLPMVRRLKQGELPNCAQKALQQSTVVITEESSPTCTGCPLAKGGSNRGALTIRLEHNGKVYGLLSANLPARFLTEPEEYFLFEEVAGDIAYALHGMEMEQERKQAEEELSRLYEELKTLNLELEERVKERTSQLEEAVQTAEVASRAKSDFLASMSHELRTPLNAIIGFSQVLQEQYFGKLNKKQVEYVVDVLESGKYLLSLINDILDLAKIEAGKMELELSKVIIKDLLGSSLIMIKEKALVHGISLDINTTGDLEYLKIMVDERRVKQVMFNLLSNAAKFTPDGGSIRVEGKKEGKELIISVSDTGIGIAPEEQERVFEEFYQAGGTIKDKTPGTGLGLPVTKSIVKMHGGRIWVESEGPDKGSRFTFTLPI